MLGWFRIVLRGLPGLVLLMAVGYVQQAEAQVGSARYASLVMDAGSGQILSAANADEPRYPASLTKMMTIYMLFEALRDRRVSLDEVVPVSQHAASMSPSKLGLLPGTTITVEQALLGLVTKSANDAAAALGELMGGDEERFAQMMTLRARALGMSRTTFRNASGWPDPDQVTTARDLALAGPPSHPGLSAGISLFQRAVFCVPRAVYPESRPHAADLSRRRWAEDGLHRCVRLQLGDVGGAWATCG